MKYPKKGVFLLSKGIISFTLMYKFIVTLRSSYTYINDYITGWVY